MKKIHILSLVFVLMLCLCACGAKEDEQNQTAQNQSGEPKYGGSITVAITQDVNSTDPHKLRSAGAREIFYNLYEGLVKVDIDGNMIPAVCESYEISSDSMRYRFVLRQDVKFSDGSKVSGEDVVYSLKRCAGLLENPDPEIAKTSAYSIIQEIRSFEENGKTLIELTLSGPDTELIYYLTTAIVPNGFTGEEGFAPGVAPFRLCSYRPLQELVIEKNEHYYNPRLPYLDGVTFRILSDTDAAFMALLGGSIDYFPYISADQAKSLTDDFRVETGNLAMVQALFLNNAVAPFDNPLVRQALNYALDRQFIIDMVAEGEGKAVCSAIFPGFAKYYDASLEQYYSKDIEKAKELLSEAGYPSGFSFTITVPSNYKFHVDTAQVIAEQLKEVGIAVRVESIEWASWHSDVYNGRQYEATIIGLDSNLAPSDILRFYPSDSAKNFMNYSSQAFDEIFQKAKTEAEDATKVSYYKELQGILTKDAPAVFLQNPSMSVAVNKKLGGVTFFPIFVQDMASLYYME